MTKNAFWAQFLRFCNHSEMEILKIAVFLGKNGFCDGLCRLIAREAKILTFPSPGRSDWTPSKALARKKFLSRQSWT